MKVDFDYGELLTLSCSLHCLDVVYGDNSARTSVMKKVDEQLEIMNNLPVDQLYPGAVALMSDAE